jgi:hypothetical protein
MKERAPEYADSSTLLIIRTTRCVFASSIYTQKWEGVVGLLFQECVGLHSQCHHFRHSRCNYCFGMMVAHSQMEKLILKLVVETLSSWMMKIDLWLPPQRQYASPLSHQALLSSLVGKHNTRQMPSPLSAVCIK